MCELSSRTKRGIFPKLHRYPAIFTLLIFLAAPLVSTAVQRDQNDDYSVSIRPLPKRQEKSLSQKPQHQKTLVCHKKFLTEFVSAN
jgi:hypothetical protein